MKVRLLALRTAAVASTSTRATCIADRAEPAAGIERAGKARRAEPSGLLEALAEAAERFFVETRERRAAELVIDHETHRVRADVDDGVMRPHTGNPRRVELQRAPRLALRPSLPAV